MAGDAGSEGNLNPEIVQARLNLQHEVKYFCEKVVFLTLIKFKFRRMAEQRVIWSMKLYSVGGASAGDTS